MSDNPWKDLVVPVADGTITARRVDAANKWDFFWARDPGGRYLLVLRVGDPSCASSPLPKLKGLQVAIDKGPSDVNRSLVLTLLDSQQRDIFLQLCHDIMAAASQATSEAGAVQSAIARTWRWHHLLRGGAGSRMSIDEQKGLLGELVVLEKYLLPMLGSAGGVGAWRGPLGAPQDFVVGRIAIESKTTSSRDADAIRISSEFQLCDDNVRALYLHTSSFRDAADTEDEGVSVTEVAFRLRDRIANDHDQAAGRFEALLEAYGFRFEDDYSADRWVGGERAVYRVTGNFPRMVPGGLPAGVSGVNYQVSLAMCGECLISAEDMASAIEGAAE